MSLSFNKEYCVTHIQYGVFSTYLLVFALYPSKDAGDLNFYGQIFSLCAVRNIIQSSYLLWDYTSEIKCRLWQYGLWRHVVSYHGFREIYHLHLVGRRWWCSSEILYLQGYTASQYRAPQSTTSPLRETQISSRKLAPVVHQLTFKLWLLWNIDTSS